MPSSVAAAGPHLLKAAKAGLTEAQFLVAYLYQTGSKDFLKVREGGARRCIAILVCVCVCVWLLVSMCLYGCTHLYVCVHVFVHVYWCGCGSMRVCASVSVCLCA